MTLSQAVTLFFNQIALKKEIPFRISLHEPNERTQTALQDIQDKIANKDFNGAMTKEELIEFLGL